MNARFLLLTVILLSVLVIPAQSAPAPQKAPQPTSVAKNVPPKTVKVAFVNASWNKVFKWLFEQTGKPIMSCTPNGQFTFVGPPDKEYTIAQVVAAINEAFAQQPQQFVLIEREKSFMLHVREEIVGGR